MSTALEPRAVAIKAAIAAELPSGVSVYDVDEVPGTNGGPSASSPPVRYVSFELTRRYVAKRSAGGWVTVPGFALTTHYRAANVTDCRNLCDRTTEALENRAYDLPDGDTVGPFSFEFDDQPDYVEGGWSAFTTWIL